ncbi:MAG: hypothetical protein IT427_07105 [Pirellulales bacterium]|nr:hypothetical protein [Pirellulales bacterium]
MRPTCDEHKALDELIPWLYLKGVSTGDFREALQALVGEEAAVLDNPNLTVACVIGDGEAETGPLAELFLDAAEAIEMGIIAAAEAAIQIDFGRDAVGLVANVHQAACAAVGIGREVLGSRQPCAGLLNRGHPRELIVGRAAAAVAVGDDSLGESDARISSAAAPAGFHFADFYFDVGP